MTGPTAEHLHAARDVVLAAIVNGHDGAMTALEEVPSGDILGVAACLATLADRSRVTLTGDEFAVLAARWSGNP